MVATVSSQLDPTAVHRCIRGIAQQVGEHAVQMFAVGIDDEALLIDGGQYPGTF